MSGAAPLSSVWRPGTSVKVRFALTQGILMALIIGLLALTLGVSARHYLVTTTQKSYEILADNLAASIFTFYSNPSDPKSQSAIIDTVNKVEGQQGVKYVIITDADNKVTLDTNNALVGQTLNDSVSSAIATSKGNLVDQKLERPDDHVLYWNYAAPFISQNRVLYTVRLGVDAAAIDGQFNSLARNFLTTALIGILIGVVAAYLLSARLTRPILSLTESALAIRAGNLNAYADISTNDELEQLSREFQSMVEKLKGFYFQEYTQKKEALQAQGRAEEINTRLQELDRQKTDFLNAASHQLRTPLTVIHWSLSLIVEEAPHMNFPKEQLELLTEALKSTTRMVDLVNDLLDVSRIEQGRMELSWGLGNYCHVAEQLVAALQPLARNKDLTLTYEAEDGVPDSWLDEKKFYQVINNFVDNAIKYTTSGFVKVTCGLDGPDHVAIKVADSGIGMTDEEKTRLFSRFTRGSDASKMNANGSGLGMFVAKTILTQHGGDISVDTEKGKGTTFTLTVPLYHDEPKNALLAVSESTQMGSTTGGTHA